MAPKWWTHEWSSPSVEYLNDWPPGVIYEWLPPSVNCMNDCIYTFSPMLLDAPHLMDSSPSPVLTCMVHVTNKCFRHEPSVCFCVSCQQVMLMYKNISILWIDWAQESEVLRKSWRNGHDWFKLNGYSGQFWIRWPEWCYHTGTQLKWDGGECGRGGGPLVLVGGALLSCVV